MKQLKVGLTSTESAEDISSELDAAERHQLAYVLWKKPAETPEVSFSILHDSKMIYLKYFVKESERRETVHKTNGAVWEDNCVEFFISLDNGLSYFNFEFNSAGVRLGAFGTSKTKRKLLPVSIVDTIIATPDVIDLSPGIFNWNLFVAIPVTVFQQPAGYTVSGRDCKVNFYKCGDKLKDPHFLSWSAVESEEANFHLPAYFGDFKFASE